MLKWAVLNDLPQSLFSRAEVPSVIVGFTVLISVVALGYILTSEDSELESTSKEEQKTWAKEMREKKPRKMYEQTLWTKGQDSGDFRTYISKLFSSQYDSLHHGPGRSFKVLCLSLNLSNF